MLHINYFRSNSCESAVDWGALGVKNYNNGIQPIRSDDLERIERTFWLSFWYLIFNIYLVFASVILYRKLEVLKKIYFT